MKKSKEVVAEWDLEARRNLRKVPRLSIPSSSATDGFCISDNPLDCTTPSMAPHTPYRDLGLNSRPQQCISAEGGGSTSSVDSRRVWDSSGSRAAALGRYGDRTLSTEPRKIDDCTVSEDRGWSADDCASQCQKRLKRTSGITRGDDHTTMAESDTYPEVDDTTRIRKTSTATTQDFDLPVTSRKSSHPKGEAGGVPSDDEADVVLYAASALVSLSTDSRRLASACRRTSSASSASSASTSSSASPSDEAIDEESVRPSASDDVAILSSRNSGRGSGSSVLSRPSHKQRYRLVAAVLAASPRIDDS